jgi:transglutaminase-like putative cysteine protease
MMAICPAGPPKLMKPSLSQKRRASAKETEEAGREVSTKKVDRVASAWTGHRQSVKLREAEVPLHRMVAAASPEGAGVARVAAPAAILGSCRHDLRNLRPTAFIDSDHPAVQAFAAEHARGASDRERAVALVYAVRDGFRYDPYRIDLSPAGMKASTVLANGYGWCVPKATLLAAACRAAGIPARLGFADVRNHLSTERMRETMKTDLFVWHGYTDIWIDGAWRKATPAFNLALCRALRTAAAGVRRRARLDLPPVRPVGPPAHGVRASAREL